jgi:hypothetical protein
MQKPMLAALAAIAVATLSLAVVPAFTSTAMAARGGDNPGDTVEETCVHNGNGRVTEGECRNPSGTDVTTTCDKIRGKFVCTTTSD